MEKFCQLSLSVKKIPCFASLFCFKKKLIKKLKQRLKKVVKKIFFLNYRKLCLIVFLQKIKIGVGRCSWQKWGGKWVYKSGVKSGRISPKLPRWGRYPMFHTLRKWNINMIVFILTHVQKYRFTGVPQKILQKSLLLQNFVCGFVPQKVG